MRPPFGDPGSAMGARSHSYPFGHRSSNGHGRAVSSNEGAEIRNYTYCQVRGSEFFKQPGRIAWAGIRPRPGPRHAGRDEYRIRAGHGKVTAILKGGLASRMDGVDARELPGTGETFQ